MSRIGILVFFLLLWSVGGFGQTPIIGGNVYGGGNQADVDGNATVTVTEGDIDRVYGGARMANVGGRTFVNIENEGDDPGTAGVDEGTVILINQVFGGNDIAGTIGTDGDADKKDKVPTELKAVKRLAADDDNPKKNTIDNTWNTYIRIGGNGGPITKEGETGHEYTHNALLIGSLYGGSNGDYVMLGPGEPSGTETTYRVYDRSDTEYTTPIAERNTAFTPLELRKTYLEIMGGSIGQIFGGGNYVTVSENTTIFVDNPTKVVNEILRDGYDILTGRGDKMGYNSGYTYMSSDAFQVGNFFGGNNKADMAIRPTWNLQSGKIRNLYSGGNKGAMTNPKGIILDIKPEPRNVPPEADPKKNDQDLVIDYVYGGCRMGDVYPKDNHGVMVATVQGLQDEGYYFPSDLAARVLIRGGDINNVFGGNDVTGRVYFGSAVGIYSSIRGDVYGGGNGSYPYTDNEKLKDDPIYGDLYYNPGEPDYPDGATEEQKNQIRQLHSVDALNAFRPNAEQVSLYLEGKEDNHVLIGGSVFVGGNSATLKTDLPNPLVELKIGSYVYADNVYLGNNGENMVQTNETSSGRKEGILRTMAGNAKDSGGNEIKDKDNNPIDVSSLNFTNTEVFNRYMSGCAMDKVPNIVFAGQAETDKNIYQDNTTYIGSLFCGGNVGSMTYEGKHTLSIDRKLIIFDKLVGGCNNANVAASDCNAAYAGGVIGNAEEQEEDGTGYTNYYNTVDGKKKIKDRLELNFENLKVQPMRWNDTFTEVAAGTLVPGKEYYTTDLRSSKFIATGTETSNPADPTKTYYELTTKGTTLEWNTALWDSNKQDFMKTGTGGPSDTTNDDERRLLGGNIYGGCYNSGHVNGNVVINVNKNVIEKSELFADISSYNEEEDEYIINESERNSGVILDRQSYDVNTIAMTVFGAGYGKDTEIWGSTTVNLNNGYCLQTFGGGEKGIVGKPIGTSSDVEGHYVSATGNYTSNGKLYHYNEAYSTTVNLKGTVSVDNDEDIPDGDFPETEYIYGGGNEGDVCGNTLVNLGNGRIYDSFGGASDANILGHSETYIGRSGVDGSGNNIHGFPWIRDIVYGGNDFGGKILGRKNYTPRVRDGALSMLQDTDDDGDDVKDVLQANSYVEFIEGHVDEIFAGNYGDYDYADRDYQPNAGRPDISSAFMHLRPISHSLNQINKVYGGSEGHSHDREGDLMQNRSYVLVDIPDEIENFRTTEVFGAGKNNGVGMSVEKEKLKDGTIHPDGASAIIDLVRGQIANVFGGSYSEGITRRTVVNVPEHSTIRMYTNESSRTKVEGYSVILPQAYGNIFGGAYGTQVLPPCDVYESNVNYRSSDAVVQGAIYGGNNHERRTLRTHVNISAPVWSTEQKATNGYLGTVFGAGQGKDTWSEYTEVNLENGAQVYEVYGGGLNGHVLNSQSVWKYMQLYKPAPSSQIARQDPTWRKKLLWANGGPDDPESTYTLKPGDEEQWAEDWKDAWTLGDYYDPGDGDDWENYVINSETNLDQIPNRLELDGSDNARVAAQFPAKKFNANVIINPGAYVGNYAYGAGYGRTNDALSGDVYGTSYIALLGGTVAKDIYAAGTAGSVYDLFGVGAFDAIENPNGFTASANAFIRGGTCRNVYGGGWRGNVGYAKYRDGAELYRDDNEGIVVKEQIPDFWDDEGKYTDILGEANVVIGTPTGMAHADGIPSVTRNVYGGGEGGSIFGQANVVINNGYIGYRYKNTVDEGDPVYEYVAEVDDNPGDGKLEERSGSVFGGGYVCNSYVDVSNVKMYGGTVRNSVFGGGEIGPIGRGTVRASAPTLSYSFENGDAKIYKGGETHVEIFDGHVMRNVYGGGRGRDNWGTYGWMTPIEEMTLDQSSRGYVFGSTDVHIRGGEIGTAANAIQGDGNVFGGGYEGFVYSATGKKFGEWHSDEDLVEGKASDGGGYYYDDADGDDEYDDDEDLTLDCYVEVSPYCKVKTAVTIDGTSYAVGDYVPLEKLNKLRNRNASTEWGSLDTKGVIIHNAVFAGGNIPTGSDVLSANTVTVYGNVAASLRDVYNYDLITIGSDELGGLYGDGNLTLVDGFRELLIDNYGTDYYSLDPTMTLDEYSLLTDRQKAYYQLRYETKEAYRENHTYYYYECKENHKFNHVTYKRGQKIPKTGDPYAGFDAEEKKKWVAGQKTFQADEQIDAGEYLLMDAAEQDKWELFGVCSIYAGRPMNTLQRADFCGVWGSRMVMKGAQDRVSTTYDQTNYTINRVDEVSLNKKNSVITADLTLKGDRIQAANFPEDQNSDDFVDPNAAVHGNYFGIYSVVNYLGNLTSDVFFDNVRTTDTKNDDIKGDGFTTFYEWKSARPYDKYRNNGTSHNMVALASGVYLEIKREETEKAGEDKWGYITGVVELDLINVMTGMGGGYVYARNEHGTKTWHGNPNITSGDNEYWGKVTLLEENRNARTYRRFEYTDKADEANLQKIETSGNFIHNVKQIVDDCYPNGGIYKDGYVKSPAHYWYIKGSIYVYDQYISAYTGSANAYAETVEIPLAISAASNGRLTLREVQPNYYAYYEKNGNKIGDPSVDGVDDFFVANGITYKLNDPISYWQYRLLTEGEKAKFVEETYVTIAGCTLGNDNVPVPEGTVMLPGNSSTADTYEYYKSLALTKVLEEGKPAVKYVHDTTTDKDVPFDYVFRQSNNLSHDTGYILTYDVNNPMVWNNYYTKTAAPGTSINTDQYTEGKIGNTPISRGDYTESPTYKLKPGVNAAVFGQHEIKQGSVVYGTAVTDYTTNVYSHLTTDEKAEQAIVEAAYIVKETISVKDASGSETNQLNPGVLIAKSDYVGEGKSYSFNDNHLTWDALVAAGKIEAAQVCTSLLKFSEDDYVYAGKALTSTDIATLKSKVIAANPSWSEGEKDAKATEFLNEYISDAYYCTQGGLYGGSYFSPGTAYRALESFNTMSKKDREKFVFNYDALDLLIDPTYDGRLEDNYGYKPQYDGPNSPKIYSVETPIDYRAEFVGVDDENDSETIEYTPKVGSKVTITESSAEEDWLTREAYEAIPNEQHHYSPINVTNPGNYYVVKESFLRGDIPYSVGETITEEVYTALTEQQKADIDVLEFTEESGLLGTKTIVEDDVVYAPVTYYYCREPYTINEKGEGVAITATAGIVTMDGTTVAAPYAKEEEVPQGVIISSSTYKDLPNKQLGFVIHGTSPTETSTLYVSNESDIFDLSKEKIITVIYLYEYEESDESGNNVMPMSERHIVNIHINFKSGVPTIGKLKKPDLVLPGTAIGMEIPTVTQGAYNITDSGWEIFAKERDADSHTNGQPYYNNSTPVYWYQNNYWIAYYAETYLGKTYSNSVQFNVANYHDLKKVMDDKEHHYYIDHKDAAYEPKIYINDYSASGKNGLDMFKDLIDLSYVNKTYDPLTGEPEPVSGGALDGHVPMDNTLVHQPSGKTVKGGDFFEFFLRTDIDHSTKPNPDYDSSDPESPETIPYPWTPIASNDGECFKGVLHGDGYAIHGLDHSLIDKLCGKVYNLGVTGSFTSAGVANYGEGYVENCWINTTGTPESDIYAVFGEPARDGADLIQIVNSYCQTGKTYKTSPATHGVATPKPDQAFYNGEVAYDLNGFYLYKRYSDNKPETEGSEYYYWKPGEDEPQKAYYASNPGFCSSGFLPEPKPSGFVVPMYVEQRFADGDFRYADGTIPSSEDVRHCVDAVDEDKEYWLPIWPDDYIFFGQKLTYGHVKMQTHQDVPSHIVKNGNNIETNETGNRVYRAPSYHRNSEMKVAHFNPHAVFAQTKKDDASIKAYPEMTAIDFTGYNDVFDGASGTLKPYQLGTAGTHFYDPLLDDDGLTGFVNADETKNLLAYIPQPDNAARTMTYNTVNTANTDPDYVETDAEYRTVDQNGNDVRFHVVEQTSDVDKPYQSIYDHFLVDKQDFNAPISYTFDSGKRMWYQRMPDNYVGKRKDASTFIGSDAGWEGVSLPFSAELVTTNRKGEITHFYQTEDALQKSKNGTNTMIGHEYWLRDLKGDDLTLKSGETDVLEATFGYPGAGSDIMDKTVENIFLWDYYYNGNHSHQDKNLDTYQTYYKTPRNYNSYAMLTRGIPYIIGFPGERYYEFDLSGNFDASTTNATRPLKLGKQVITFASKEGETIQVSDNEKEGKKVSYNSTDYYFKPSYLNEELNAGNNYVLNSNGNAYIQLSDAVTTYNTTGSTYADADAFAAAGTLYTDADGTIEAKSWADDATTYYKRTSVKELAKNEKNQVTPSQYAFRPYFSNNAASGTKEYKGLTRAIVFSSNTAEIYHEEEEDDMSNTGDLYIRAKKGKILVTSTLREAKDIVIVTAAGALIDRYTIQPGETIETPVNASGVYIVNNKKIAVKIKD